MSAVVLSAGDFRPSWGLTENLNAVMPFGDSEPEDTCLKTVALYIGQEVCADCVDLQPPPPPAPPHPLFLNLNTCTGGEVFRSDITF